MALNCPAVVGTASTIAAAATARVARVLPVAMVPAMPHTAWATTATAAILRPCSQAASSDPNRSIPEREQDEGDGRGQGEPGPGRERAGEPGAVEADADADLAAGRPRQELAQRHQVRIGGLVEPMTAGHEFLPEVAEMGDRPAERGQPQPQERDEHFERVALAGGRRRFGGGHVGHDWAGWLMASPQRVVKSEERGRHSSTREPAAMLRCIAAKRLNRRHLVPAWCM